ncbi:MAG: hypothetical protein NT007_09690 [Candidatus Kapabacteria bacterium]|nr:hypothetical protein [Candidatus Kapabacteria bacterium]
MSDSQPVCNCNCEDKPNYSEMSGLEIFFYLTVGAFLAILPNLVGSYIYDEHIKAKKK